MYIAAGSYVFRIYVSFTERAPSEEQTFFPPGVTAFDGLHEWDRNSWHREQKEGIVSRA